MSEGICPKLTLSVVSHGQIGLIKNLLDDIHRSCELKNLEVLITQNIPEEVPFSLQECSFPVVLLKNELPQGFAKNHNQAFTRAKGDFFCVVNPDIRFDTDPFAGLIECLTGDNLDIVGPLVLNPDNTIADSARRFPTLISIFARRFQRKHQLDYSFDKRCLLPDWIGGMFMMFRADTYKNLGGFDTKYFLYFEDVDLCARAKLLQLKVGLLTEVRVVHEARRSSHRNLKFLKWHVVSMAKFFLSKVYWRLRFAK